VKNLGENLPEDPERAMFVMPDFVGKMIERGLLATRRRPASIAGKRAKAPGQKPDRQGGLRRSGLLTWRLSTIALPRK